MITQIFTLLLIISAVLGQSSKNCTENAKWNDCASACPETCKNVFVNSCNKRCEPRCACNPGYVFQGNNCIPIEKCDPRIVQCPKNATFTTCGSYCPRTCASLYYNEIFCIQICKTTCACNNGYVPNSNGQCVLIKDCNPNEIRCAPDMKYNPNGVLKTCKNVNGTNEQKKPGCYCDEDSVYDEARAICVSPQMCPNSPENKDCKSKDENMEYRVCQSSSCVKTCTRQNPTACTYDCRRGCFCMDGYVQLENKCVTPDKCPAQ